MNSSTPATTLPLYKSPLIYYSFKLPALLLVCTNWLNMRIFFFQIVISIFKNYCFSNYYHGYLLLFYNLSTYPQATADPSWESLIKINNTQPFCLQIRSFICVYMCTHSCECEGWNERGISINVHSQREKEKNVFYEIHRGRNVSWHTSQGDQGVAAGVWVWVGVGTQCVAALIVSPLVDHHSLFLHMWSQKEQGLLQAKQSSGAMKEASVEVQRSRVCSTE